MESQFGTPKSEVTVSGEVQNTMTVSHRRGDLCPGVPIRDSESVSTSSVTDRIPLPRNRVSVPHFEATLGRASLEAGSLPNISRDQHKLIQKSVAGF